MNVLGHLQVFGVCVRIVGTGGYKETSVAKLAESFGLWFRESLRLSLPTILAHRHAFVCFVLSISLAAGTVAAQQRRSQSREPVQQTSYCDDGAYMDDYCVGGGCGSNPFGWQAGDRFDGCGYGAECGPGPGLSTCRLGNLLGLGTPVGCSTSQFIEEDVACIEGEALGCSEILDGCTTIGSPCQRWSVGVEFALLKPHFEGNPAFTTQTGNGTTQEDFVDNEFNFDADLAPRIWVEVLRSGNLGWRARYWQFEDSAHTATGTPDANGFGRISHPPFGDVDLSTAIPGSTFTADSLLDAYTIDLETTNSFNFCSWAWMATAGLRFAEIEQNYVARLQDEDNANQGTINYSHRAQGLGPVIGIRVQRPWLQRLAIFGVARGSVLFGDSDSNLVAIEDLDLQEAMTTRRTTTRDDLLPIGELQLGLQWLPVSCGNIHPYLHLALEGQVWGGAGNASSEDGNLGFYGANLAVGFDW